MKLISGVKLKNRRKRALERLEAQLVSRIKPVKSIDRIIDNATLPLTEHDIKRINQEILTIKSKIK
jgi:hypothetical protein